MTRHEAVLLANKLLLEYKLDGWGVRLNTDVSSGFLGLCSYRDRLIILSAHHIDIHPSDSVENTIRHEIAHALTEGEGHSEVWKDMARKVGCDNTAPCSNLSLTPQVIDAIRSGSNIEISFDEEIIRTPKYRITRLQDKCGFCGKVAKEIRSTLVVNENPFQPDEKYIMLECGHLLIKKIPKGTAFHTLISNSDEPHVKSCKHEFRDVHPTNQCIHCLEYKPYDFQVEGMRFLETALAINKGGAIFDDMGLGKTIQGLGTIKFVEDLCPILFLGKSTAKFQVFKEVLRWCGNSYLPQIIRSGNDYLIPGLKVYIASYDMLVKKVRRSKTGKIINQGFDLSKFDAVGIKTVILDECQQIKNADASRTQEVRKLVKDRKVIALSGTPWKNRGSEFFQVLNMMAPTKFPSYQGFLDTWVDYYQSGTTWKPGGIKNIPAFREYIKDIALRREVSDVQVEMPDVNRTMQYTELEKYEQANYDEEVSKFVKWYNDLVMSGEEDDIWKPGENNVIGKLARMRHIIGLAKIPATLDLTDQFVEETDRKLVIFVHHKDVGEILYSKIKEKWGSEIPVLKLTGDQTDIVRFNIQTEFNNHPRALMVASTLAAGESINLQTCSDAIMHERQWNPQNEDQAAPGRFRRIGSIHALVNVIFMLASGTVDEHLTGIVERKRGFFHAGMNKGEMPVWNQSEIISELVNAIVKGYNSRVKKSVKVG